MSVRLTGETLAIVVPAAEIVCDVCQKAWPYDPNIIHFQDEDHWRNAGSHYAVTLRHCVGGKMPTEVFPNEHACRDCLAGLFRPKLDTEAPRAEPLWPEPDPGVDTVVPT